MNTIEGSSVSGDLSFDEICGIEPQIKDLYSDASQHTLNGDPTYLWEHFFKPSVDRLVGPQSINPRLIHEEIHTKVATQISDALWRKS